MLVVWVRKLAFGLVVAAMIFAMASPVHALDCEGFALDDGCFFTITGGDTTDPDDGYAVTNAHGVPMWDFVRDREAQAIGYPISQRWTEDPFTLQAFQKVILQWDPIKQRMNYYNTLDALGNRYPWISLPFVPPHQVLEEDQGATFGTIIRNHLALLDQNEAIKERFLGEPDWLNLYGLPIRYEEREVDGNPAGVQLLRTQRTVFVVWKVPAAGVTVGRVNLQNVPDKLKQLSNVVIPDTAKSLARAPDPGLHPAIRALPWVADGVFPHEQDSLLLLRKLASSSEELLSRLLVARQPAWLQRLPDAQGQGALRMISAFADIPWARKHIGPAQPLLLSVLLNATEDQWPSSFRKLMLKPWIRDGVTWGELRLAEIVVTQALVLPEARNPQYNGKHEEIDNILNIMLDMPYLDSFEGYETTITEDLFYGYNRTNPRTGANEWLHGMDLIMRILRGFAATGGITDRQALFPSPPYFNGEPEEYAAAVNHEASEYSVVEKDVFLPLSGRVRIVLVNSRDSANDSTAIVHTLGTIESVLNEVVAFTQVPFPGHHVRLTDFVVPGSASELREARRQLVRRFMAHHNGYEVPYWATEGMAAVVELGLGYRPPNWTPSVADFQRPDRQVDCPTNSVNDAFQSSNASCHEYIGVTFFLALYRSLDSVSFHNGLARMIATTNGRIPLYSYCWMNNRILDIPCVYAERPPFETAFTDAFTTGVTPEAAAIARAVIQRWYHGR